MIGSLICGIAGSSTVFILGRAVAGPGSAGLQNGAFEVIRHKFDLLGNHGLARSRILRQYIPVELGHCHGPAGHYRPFAAACAVIVTIGSGLLATFDPFTPTAQWVGYEVFVGAGRGLGIQIAAIAILASTPARLAGMATATMVFCQTFSAWGIGWKGIRRKKDLIEGRET
ncbi:hypothetical protein MAJ_03182, partial [Metarhizium majus ARSEF 297]